ncbi:MAG: response regulator transcription factor [Alphaproteobacteria bacterium]
MDGQQDIYVVDDDEATRQSLGTLLDLEGYNVQSFDTGTALLAALSPSSQGCVLLDVRMPGPDGLEVQETLLERGVGLPIIIVTGHGNVPMAVRAMKMGAFDFIEKPYEAASLLETVKRALTHDKNRRHGLLSTLPKEEIERRITTLTPREYDVMGGVVRGLMNKQIAGELGISDRTVEIHRARVMEKMQAHSLADLIRLSVIAEEV